MNVLDDVKHCARLLLGREGHFEDGGIPAGGFGTALLLAWERADMSNRARLEWGWPAMGEAVEAFTTGGRDALVALIGGEK